MLNSKLCIAMTLQRLDEMFTEAATDQGVESRSGPDCDEAELWRSMSHGY